MYIVSGTGNPPETPGKDAEWRDTGKVVQRLKEESSWVVISRHQHTRQ